MMTSAPYTYRQLTSADVAHLVEVLAAAGALELPDCPIPVPDVCGPGTR